MKIQTIKIKKGYSIKEIGGEFCIVHDDDTNNGAVNGLPSINETGIFLWDRVMKNFTPEALIEALIERNNLDYEDAEADVGEFIAKLINGNIIDITRSR
ncbi:MAG: PqqD family protein [Anaerocolumna sp.]